MRKYTSAQRSAQKDMLEEIIDLNRDNLRLSVEERYIALRELLDDLHRRVSGGIEGDNQGVEEAACRH